MARLAGGRSSETIRSYLEGLEFPMLKNDLVHALRQKGAPNDVVATLEAVPNNEFASADEVVQSYPGLD